MAQSVHCIFDSVLSHTCRSDASEKREENSVENLAKFACAQNLSRRLYRLSSTQQGNFFVLSRTCILVDFENW